MILVRHSHALCLLLQLVALAGRDELGGIDSLAVNLLFQNLPVFSDEKVHATCRLVLVAIETVLAGDIASPITQQRKGDTDLVGEGFVGEGTVHAHTQDLGVGCFQLGQVLLEVFELLGSTPGESEDVERQHHVLLAAVLA